MANAQTTRIDWINEALEVIEQAGFDAVRVEVLARRLGVTKGGFYYNFDNRDALVDAALTEWERRAVDEVIRGVDDMEPLERLERLFDITSFNQRIMRIDAAIAAASLAGHAQVRAAHERIHKRRFDYVETIYRELGFDAAASHTWATAAYAMFLGVSQLAALDRGIFETDAHLEAHRRHVRAIVVPTSPPISETEDTT